MLSVSVTGGAKVPLVVRTRTMNNTSDDVALLVARSRTMNKGSDDVVHLAVCFREGGGQSRQGRVDRPELDHRLRGTSGEIL